MEDEHVIVVPAIDIRGGRCVRLIQGDYNREVVFDAEPADAARRWADAGAGLLHVVDLDGAREGLPVNLETVLRIRDATDVRIELGGGIRDEETVERVIDAGIDRVVLGTRSLEDPEWVLELAERFGGRIVAGIDALDGKVRTRGWLHASDVAAADLAKRLDRPCLGAMIVTDISRDGMLLGPNVAFTQGIACGVSVPVFAAGGVSLVEHVRELAGARVAGVVIGKALYDGRIDLGEAITAAAEASPSARED